VRNINETVVEKIRVKVEASYTCGNTGAALEIFDHCPNIQEHFGFALASLGQDKVLIGADGKYAGAADVGAAYLFGTNGALVTILTNPTPAASDMFGYAVAALGTDKVAIGAPGDHYGANVGGAAYLFSSNGALLFTFNNPTLASGDRFGISVASAGDVNGDGFADVIVGAWANDAGGADAGRAYVYFGGPAADATPDLALTGAAANDSFGYSVASAGDVNGDGFADLLVGAYGSDAGGADAGRAYVYFGGPAADATPDLTLTGAAANDVFGYSAASAGDVNGDGFDDIMVGAFLSDAGGADVARLRDHAGHVDQPVVAVIADRVTARQHQRSGRGIDLRVGLPDAALERGGDRERLHRRARLVGVGNGPVSQQVGIDACSLVRIEGGVLGKGEDIAAAGIEHENEASLGAGLGDLAVELAFRDVLKGRIEGEHDVRPLSGCFGDEAACQEPPPACVPLYVHLCAHSTQVAVVGELDASEAL